MHRKHGLLAQPRATAIRQLHLQYHAACWTGEAETGWVSHGEHSLNFIPIQWTYVSLTVTNIRLWKHFPNVKDLSLHLWKAKPAWKHLRARAGPHPTPEMLRSGHQMLLSGPMEWTGMEVKSKKSLQIHLKFVRSSQARASTLVTVLWKLKRHHFSPKLRISEVETKWRRLHTLCIHISDLQSAPKDGIKRG